MADSTVAQDGVTIQDNIEKVKPYVSSAAELLAKNLISVSQNQVDYTISEIKALSTTNKTISAHYTELADNVGDIKAYREQSKEIFEALAPHLKSIDSLDEVISKLEISASQLDTLTRELESHVYQILT